MASSGNPKQQQQGGGGIIAGGRGFDLNKLFKPSSSNRMNMMQPHIQQEQQRQQGHFPSTNSNNDIVSLFYIYIKGWVSAGFTRVDRVSPGQLPDEFLLGPGPVPGPGRPGPGSTRRTSPGFKTMLTRKEAFVLYRTQKVVPGIKPETAEILYLKFYH
jgi:hypothetical protein